MKSKGQPETRTVAGQSVEAGSHPDLSGPTSPTLTQADPGRAVPLFSKEETMNRLSITHGQGFTLLVCRRGCTPQS